DEIIFKVVVQGVGFRQDTLLKDSVLGFYTTFGILADNIFDVKLKLPLELENRMLRHSVYNYEKKSFNYVIIEGIYSGEEKDLLVDGFSFFKATLFNRLSFYFRWIYLKFFDSVRIVKIAGFFGG
ncbi:hypothetical protein QE250_09055, partial [Chromatiaceae bacterium AAb-1]|nr:hypothetical protein [Chromatiaceae bacterium AAb-1]